MDLDLQSIQEARDCLARGKNAAAAFASFDQEAVDRVVTAVAQAAEGAADRLARLAVEDTGFGVVEHKVQKNLFAARDVYEYIKDLKTCDVIAEDPARGLTEIASPVGLIAGITPTTNPTSTVIYKALIALKARNAIVFSPHPAAAHCSGETARLLAEAAVAAEAPEGVITWLAHPTPEAAREIMGHADVDLLLATGGLAMVRAAYSSGKPAYGVGPGNVPAYIDRSADVPRAVADIVASKTFDNGVICASEQGVVCDAPVRAEARQEFERAGGVFLTEGQKEAVAKVLDAGGKLNPAVVGQPAARIASLAGFDVPPEARILIGFEDRVGREAPFSWEKISPVLAWYDVPDWVRGCERCLEILAYGGMGHTLALHARDENVIREFGLRKPVFRVVVNTPASQGAIGLTTNLAPALTLGCGTLGGNITSDNITPLHLLHRKRVAHGRDGGEEGRAEEAAPRPAKAVDARVVARVVEEVLRQLYKGGP
ncbi:MAG: aldehyde dehydrogenase family protein [Candidatus Coatesbacteria bacterium]|nr:MAG: aldehyde dehydrogenase family protein [Candidatus Coatesbacteria bacterium]